VVNVVAQNMQGSLKLTGTLKPVSSGVQGPPGKGGGQPGQGREFTVNIHLRVPRLMFKQPVNGTDLAVYPGEQVFLQATVEVGNGGHAKSGTMTWNAPANLGTFTQQSTPILVNGSCFNTFSASGSPGGTRQQQKGQPRL